MNVKKPPTGVGGVSGFLITPRTNCTHRVKTEWVQLKRFSESGEGKSIGRIVETEAYLEDDPASHSFRGKTKRNEVMFGSPGRAYIYFTYGMHHCFNVVTNIEGVGEAVLIRALEPISGIELMKKRRGIEDVKNLCNGPAKLFVAMGISKEMNGLNLESGKLRIEQSNDRFDIISSNRIGISQGSDLKYRFFIKGNEFVSASKSHLF